MKNKTIKILSSILIFALTISVLAFSGCIEEEVEEEPKNIVETAIASDDFNTLVEALTTADLVTTLKDETEEFTVFAPTDAAFDKLDESFLTDLLENEIDQLIDILTYHLLSGRVMAEDITGDIRVETIQGKYIDITIDGSTVYINDAMVTTTDIECSNGVIHVIDTVLVPKDNIVETAIANDNFDTLVSAVVTAGLDTTLSDESTQFTVFAPTDAAFAELDSEYLNNLVQNDTANLTKILTYHVLSGEVLSTDLSDGMTAETVQGSEITVTIEDGNVYVDEAMVTVADVECSNGIIHIINKVITP
ncbi:MAG: fasciclin domain-containing protein [Candidatus Thermoplasmatota archaeon]|nr:fasciclin domain-containing protein [Candidatus Thermoplasmatota archaeon]